MCLSSLDRHCHGGSSFEKHVTYLLGHSSAPSLWICGPGGSSAAGLYDALVLPASVAFLDKSAGYALMYWWASQRLKHMRPELLLFRT